MRLKGVSGFLWPRCSRGGTRGDEGGHTSSSVSAAARSSWAATEDEEVNALFSVGGDAHTTGV